MVGNGGLVVPGLLLHAAQAVEGFGLAAPVTEVAVQRQRLLVAGGGRAIVAADSVHEAQAVEGVGLAGPVAEVAVQRQRLL